MSFTDAGAYDLFMGRFSSRLAVAFADFALPRRVGRVLDVGCGPGALTTVLAARLGHEAVSAIDPSEPFVDAVRARLPGVSVRQGAAEELPFADAVFDAALSELVVHFMADPSAGIGEMVRVTRAGGAVAACVWDMENGRAPHSVFLRVLSEVTGRSDGRERVGSRQGELVRLLHEAGCRDVAETELTVESDYATFEEWWEVHSLGVGPTAGVLDGIPADDVDELRRRCRALVGDDEITVQATAWAARGTAP